MRTSKAGWQRVGTVAAGSGDVSTRRRPSAFVCGPSCRVKARPKLPVGACFCCEGQRGSPADLPPEIPHLPIRDGLLPLHAAQMPACVMPLAQAVWPASSCSGLAAVQGEECSLFFRCAAASRKSSRLQCPGFEIFQRRRPTKRPKNTMISMSLLESRVHPAPPLEPSV